MPTLNDTDLLVGATFLLFLATAALAITAWRERGEQRRATKALEDQAAALSASSTALAASAKASQAAADEMLAARVALNPVRVSVTLAEQTPGVFNGSVENIGDVGLIIHEIGFVFGRERLAGTTTVYANQYLNPRSHFTIAEPYDRSGRDLVVLRITGEPEDGLVQTVERLFQVLPTGNLKALREGPKGQIF